MSGQSRSITIAGGGWAGLAAAVELAGAGYRITLHESARQLGGRARSIELAGTTHDNGSHLMIGAYRELRRLLKHIGVEESRAFSRQPLRLDVLNGSDRFSLKAPRLPAPLHLLVALITAEGATPAERLGAIRFALAMRLRGFHCSPDRTVDELMKEQRQPERVVRDLWEPLCIATLNTPMHKASANAFLNVLNQSFSHRLSDSDMLFPAVPLGELFPAPARRYLESGGHSVGTGERLEALHIESDELVAIIMNGERRPCRQLILATPPTTTVKLLEAHSVLAPIAESIAALQHQPITTVYLRYPETTRLGQTMIGLTGTTTQWVLDLRSSGHPGWMSAIISAEGEHTELSKEAMIERVTDELARHFPHWPAPSEGYRVREQRATLESSVASHRLRPHYSTPVRGLWLAGDYTATGLPATIEGAVISGVQCARSILARTD